MAMNIKKELDKSNIILLLVPSTGYGDIVVQNIKQLSKDTLCFVTLSKTFDSLKEEFGKKKVKLDNVVFVDAISKSMRAMPDQAAGCYYVTSPTSLTEIEIAVIKMLRHGFKYILFDSLSSMLVYQKNAPVAKFAAALANNARQSNAKVLFYAVKSDEQKQMVDQVSAIADKVIDLSK